MNALQCDARHAQLVLLTDSSGLASRWACAAPCPSGYVENNEDAAECVADAETLVAACAELSSNAVVADVLRGQCTKVPQPLIALQDGGPCGENTTQWRPDACFINCPAPLLEEGLSCRPPSLQRALAEPSCAFPLLCEPYADGDAVKASCKFKTWVVVVLVCVLLVSAWLLYKACLKPRRFRLWHIQNESHRGHGSHESYPGHGSRESRKSRERQQGHESHDVLQAKRHAKADAVLQTERHAKADAVPLRSFHSTARRSAARQYPSFDSPDPQTAAQDFGNKLNKHNQGVDYAHRIRLRPQIQSFKQTY